MSNIKELEDELLNNNDCPQEIFRTAKTVWQKNVALEFIRLYNKVNGMKSDIKVCKWLVVFIFVTLVAELLKEVVL